MAGRGDCIISGSGDDHRRIAVGNHAGITAVGGMAQYRMGQPFSESTQDNRTLLTKNFTRDITVPGKPVG